MRFRSLSTIIVAAAAFLAGCASDTSLAPTSASKAGPAGAQHSLLGLLASPQTITPLQRTTPLASSISASATVGLLGTSISIPGAGFSVVIPALAAPVGTKITVTALAGSNVAYEFAPHGLKFVLPLVATQSLRNVQNPGSLLGLRLGYFPDDTNVTSVTELLNVNVDLLGLTATSTIWHFSGYIFAGGDASSGF